VRHRPAFGRAGVVLAAAMGCALAAVLSDLRSASAFEERPGQRFSIRPDRLPKPYATPNVSNGPDYVRRLANATLRLPPGFRATLFARGLEEPRWMTVARNGDVFLADSAADRILLLRDANGDGVAELVEDYATGFDGPHGLAIHGGYLYVADTRAVWRLAYKPGRLRPGSSAKRVTKPGALGDAQGHWTRNIVFSPDGKRFYVAIGSRANLAVEALPRATVQEFLADGSGQRTFASGLRNPVGIAFYPGTSDLYVVVNERDGMGDGLVPDFLTRIRKGEFYGWPYAYIGRNPQPGMAKRRPDLVKRSRTPDLLFASHSSPLGLVFYDGSQFPKRYRGGAFVAFHGSGNASKPTGYKVVFVPFKNGRPVGYYENFATGFWAAGARKARVWGRPAGLAVARDGGLLVTDDSGGAVWYIRYKR
jgi:glucose/arabinose dehydrogenase